MKIITFLMLMTVILLPFIIFSKDTYNPPNYIKIANHLMDRTSEQLEKKYNMRLIGTYKAMMDNVKGMGFRFQIYGQMKKNEARAIVVDCVQYLLREINRDEKIRPYLNVYPFDSSHVEIILFINTQDRETFCHPELSVVSAFDGKIRFYTNDPENKYKYKVEEVESFEDAVKIVKGEKSAPPSKIK